MFWFESYFKTFCLAVCIISRKFKHFPFAEVIIVFRQTHFLEIVCQSTIGPIVITFFVSSSFYLKPRVQRGAQPALSEQARAQSLSQIDQRTICPPWKTEPCSSQICNFWSERIARNNDLRLRTRSTSCAPSEITSAPRSAFLAPINNSY